MTPEEEAQLEAAIDPDDFDALLAQFYSEGKITLEEAFALQDKYAVPQQTTPQLDMADRLGLLRQPSVDVARIGMLRQPSVGAGVKPVAQGSAPLPGAATSTIDPFFNQFLTDPYLLAYTSANDLADRLYAMFGDVPEAGQLYGQILGIRIKPIDPDSLSALLGTTAKTQADLDRTNQMAIRAAGARAQKAAEKLAMEGQETAEDMMLQQQQLGVKDLLTQRDWETQFAADQAKEQKNADITLLNSATIQSNKNNYLPGLKTYLDSSVKNGSITQEQADSQYNLESSFIDKGYDLTDLPNYASLKGMELIQTPEQALGKKAQAEVDIINQARRDKEANRKFQLDDLINQSQEAGIAQVLDERRRREVVTKAENERPGQPSYASAAEPFLASLPPNFRAFVQNVILPRIAEETAVARADWWKRKNPVAAMAEPAPAPVRTYESLLANARGDVRERGDVLRGLQLGASTGAAQDYSLGQLPYATEQLGLSQQRLADLLALGQEGYYAQQRGIPRDVMPEPRTPKPTTEEDPFLARLKQGNEGEFLAKFLMQSPEQRGYNKQRFAPRVSIRGY